MKKILSTVLACVSLFCIACTSACQGMEDIVPETYGEWDNNYVYRGNGKCKTTGEGYEQLVKSVEIDGKTYNVLACADATIREDDMYMILACQEEGKTAPVTEYIKEQWVRDLDLTYCLVVYNMQEQTQELLAKDTVVEDGLLKYYYRPTDIEVVLEDAIILRGISADDERFSSKRAVWSSFDLDGNMLELSMENGEEWQYYDWVSKEYLVAEIYNKGSYELYYRKGYLSEPILVREYHNKYNYSWSYIQQNGVEGILLQDYYKVDNGTYNERKLGDIWFYNFDTNTMSKRVSISKYAQFFGEYTYLKTHDLKTTEYFETWIEKKTAKVETDNRIYRLVYDNDGVHLEEFFDLKEGHSFTMYGIQEDKMLYCESWYENPRGCDVFGGRTAKYVQHNLVSGEKTELEFETIRGLEDEYSAFYEKERGITVGEYIYFLHEEEISEGLMSTPSQAYMLKRVNTKTNKVEIMQLWHGDERDDFKQSMGKYCKELWFVCEEGSWGEFDFYEFTVRPN